VCVVRVVVVVGRREFPSSSARPIFEIDRSRFFGEPLVGRCSSRCLLGAPSRLARHTRTRAGAPRHPPLPHRTTTQCPPARLNPPRAMASSTARGRTAS
jgi:hypothetical protein